jgi:ATP-dependent Lon protease
MTDRDQENYRNQINDHIRGDDFSKKKRNYSRRDEDSQDENDEPEKTYPKNKTRRRTRSDELFNRIRRRCEECEYFRKQTRKHQMEILDKEDEIEHFFYEEIPIRYRILFSNIPIPTKSFIIQKIDQFEQMNSYDSEKSKLNKWIKGISRIPFDKNVEMPVRISDPHEKIHHFLYEAQMHLEKTIFGQLEAKNKIIQIMAQWITNPQSKGQIIALEGPPGVGKTSLIKNGVSKALNRPFCFYALGGASDASNLEGHSYTYEGAGWGRIVEMLMESKVMNPVIFFDELDKISDTPKGHEITGVLTHLTDPTQNNTFHDKYFAGIDFDISKTLFFFSYNDKQLINPILKDRLTVIKFKGYEMDEKIQITKKYVLPELLENIGFQKEDITFTDDLIKWMISKYAKEEKGVRMIRKVFEDVLLKMNLLRLVKDPSEKEKIEMDYWIEDFKIPIQATQEMVQKLLKNTSFQKEELSVSQSMLYL